MKKNRMFGLGVGTTSVVMIFIVLCLTILGTMLYMMSKSDMVITDKKVNYAISYQMADSVAVDTLASIDNCLYEMSDGNIKFDGNDECKKLLDRIKNINIDYKEKNISYRVGLENNTFLDIVIKINTSNDDYVLKKNSYTIIRWKKVSSNVDIGKDTLNIWK